jgi:hypothetical protein
MGLRKKSMVHPGSGQHKTIFALDARPPKETKRTTG